MVYGIRAMPLARLLEALDKALVAKCAATVDACDRELDRRHVARGGELPAPKVAA